MIEITPIRIAFLAILVLLPLLLSNNAQAVLCDSGGPSKESCAIGAGDLGNQVSLRDITDTTNMTKSVIISLDKSSYRAGDIATLHITDYYANLTSYTIDKINATVISSSDHIGIPVVLTETGPNTSIFVTAFSLTSGSSSGNALHITSGDTISVKYITVPHYAPRFQATFDNAGGAGDVILSDQRLTSDDEINTPMSTVIEAVNFTLANGISIDPGTGVIHVVFSYANAELGCPIATCNPTLLDVFVEPPASGTFRGVVQDFGEPVTVDTLAQTVTADINVGSSGGGQTSGSWKIVLAFASGSPGGGGGGVIISPSSLVIDALAALPSVIGGSASASPSFSLTNLALVPNADIPENVKNEVLNRDPNVPIAPDFTTKFDFPLIIDGGGYALAGYSNKIVTVTEKTNTPMDLHLNIPATNLEHLALYTNLHGTENDLTKSDTYIIYDKDQPLQIVDPHHYFDHIKFNMTTIEGVLNKIDYIITFANPMDKSNIIFRTWNDRHSSSDVVIQDAWRVTEGPKLTSSTQLAPLQEQNIPIPQNSQTPSLVPPIASQGTTDIISKIKDWGGYSPNPISDEQFLKSLGMSGNHIPSWMMKTTRLLINGDIDQDEFIKSITYLHENGIIK